MFTSTEKSTSSKTCVGLTGVAPKGLQGDDWLKDWDNAGWVFRLEPGVRQVWWERISWIRLADHLAERDLLYSGNGEFHEFYAGWKSLLRSGKLAHSADPQGILSAIYQQWFAGEIQCHNKWLIQSWDRYVEAIATYHQPGLRIKTLDQYETMLRDLAGSFSQVLPFLEPAHRHAASNLGVLDQFYNNLRDLKEDADRGICYLPEQLLASYKLTRKDILAQTCLESANYHQLMKFWLNDYLPPLRQRALQIVELPSLHSSWQCLIEWSLHRYARIERVFQQSYFNYVEFADLYWRETSLELHNQAS